MKAIVLILVSSALLLSARAEQPAYTNHAGYAVPGVVVALDATTATISNGTGSVSVPLTIFPEAERRRIAADFVLGAAGAGQIGLLRVPPDIKRAVEGTRKAMARSRRRAEMGLCSPEESAAFCAESTAALESYLDAQAESGAITPAEREALVN